MLEKAESKLDGWKRNNLRKWVILLEFKAFHLRYLVTVCVSYYFSFGRKKLELQIDFWWEEEVEKKYHLIEWKEVTSPMNLVDWE